MGDGTLHSMICTLKLKKIHKSTNTKIEIHCACIVQHCSIYTYTTTYTLHLDISTNAFIHLGTYAVPVCPPTIAVFASAESSFMLEVNILILWPRAAVHLSMSPGFFWLTGNYMAVTSWDEFMLSKDSAAQDVPGLQHKGDFLQIKLLLLVKGQVMSYGLIL